MFFQKKRFKPFFKQLMKLRGNIQNRRKLLNFKKKKWEVIIKFYKKKIRFGRNYQKFKPIDQMQYNITRYSNYSTKYQKKFINKLSASKSLKIFYGGIRAKVLKNNIIKISRNKNIIDFKLQLLKLFEIQLNILLYRAKFSNTVKGAGQLIIDGKIYVNNVKIKSKSYRIKVGDLITINFKHIKLYKILIVQSCKWPLPPKNILINYKTMQILCINENIQQVTLSTLFLYNLRFQKILTNYI